MLAATHLYMLELEKSGKKIAQDRNLSASTNDEKKTGGSMGLATLAARASAFEKDTDDAEKSAFTGQFYTLLSAMLKY